jgi:hypothetical protein
MRPVVIRNPIINSPVEESRRHFRFDDGPCDAKKEIGGQSCRV